MMSDTKAPVYQLMDSDFRTLVQGGCLLSVRPGTRIPWQKETQFVLPDKAFGAIWLAWQGNAGVEHAMLDQAASWEGCSIRNDDRASSYTAQAASGPFQVRVSYTMECGSLLHRVAIRNTSDTPVRLLDVGYPFPCNTDFKWGQSASDKVIGHNFISEHGSHLLFVRCDGQGPSLLVMPQEGTSLEYFDAGVDNGEKARLCFTAYALSAATTAMINETGGSRMPTPGSSALLEPGQEIVHTFRYVWAADNDDVRRQLVRFGLVDVDVAPGLTVPQGALVTLSLNSKWHDLEVQYPEGTEIVSVEGGLYRFHFTHTGEMPLHLSWDQGRRRMTVTFFCTQPLQTLIEKRGAFIASHQHTDPSLWYCGLLAEWNNETGALLGPDHYDKIGGWRIYEVSCDDPGLSKPAFLSSKLVEYPIKEQVAALDLYMERFVWGGLQCTEEEPYPYALYGIPDWKKNRDSEDPGLRGKLHIWRIYDYPHIALTYYNLYRIVRDYPEQSLSQSKETYLLRARDTAIAMFTVPMDLERWDARNTGLYNELCIEWILEALEAEGLPRDRLERHWNRKSHYFATECTDLYGSEYPFDTTGFESTHILARRSLKMAEDEMRENRFNPPLLREQAVRFMETQIACNIATRGVLEPAYYWYGSDYRSNNMTYTLSYMSQMGGWAILDYALYYARNPFPYLRLGYGSLLSSWCLVNTGDWFPGEQHDGAASGGFEPLASGSTWLDQPHRGGPWYYSCEIDLGFCGGLRGAATIVAADPDMGLLCYGGSLVEKGAICEDGVNRRFHIITGDTRLHLILDGGRFDGPISWGDTSLTLRVDPCGVGREICLMINAEGLGVLSARGVASDETGRIRLPLAREEGSHTITLRWEKPLTL